MKTFAGPVEAFDYLLGEARQGRPYELGEVLDAERGEDPLENIGTGFDMDSYVWLEHPYTGRVIGNAALRVIALVPGFRQSPPINDRLFLHSKLQLPDADVTWGRRFSVARYYLTRTAVEALVDGEEPRDPGYKVEWLQGWPPSEQLASEFIEGEDSVPHTNIVTQAQRERPGLLAMLSTTNQGVFRPDELVVMAEQVASRV